MSHRPLDPIALVRRWISAACVSAVVFAGCVSDNATVTRADLPSDWQAGLAQVESTPAAFEGRYDNVGENRFRWAGDNRRKAPSVFRERFWQPLRGVAGKQPGVETFELTVIGLTQLRFVVRHDSHVVHEELREVKWEPERRCFVFHEHRNAGAALAGGHGVPGAGADWGSSQLFKGTDGCLYVQRTRRTAALALFAIPLSETEESWTRWIPASR